MRHPDDIAPLVVDDQPSMRTLMRYALQSMGVRNITDAKSGREAMHVLTHSHINLVLADWVMENGDGFTLLQSIRRHPKLYKMPFIMVTGLSEKPRVEAAIAAGVSNYLVKPFDTATLRRKIEMVLGPIGVS